LNKERRDLHEKSEQVKIMEETNKTIVNISIEMLECIPPSRKYTLFQKEKWHRNQIAHLDKFVKFNLDTPRDFLDAYKVYDKDERHKYVNYTCITSSFHTPKVRIPIHMWGMSN
jgi:hypothetical protein